MGQNYSLSQDSINSSLHSSASSSSHSSASSSSHSLSSCLHASKKSDEMYVHAISMAERSILHVSGLDDSEHQQIQTGFLQRFAVDLTSALLSSSFVAPFVTIVDKAIISNASGREKLVDCMKNTAKEALTSPLKFFRKPEFLWIFSLYSATYATANTADSVCAMQQVSPTVPKFLATTFVNISVCVSKDRAFTKMFGTVAPKPVGLFTIGLFATRDMMTVFSSFTLPQPTAELIVKTTNGALTHQQALNTAQLTLPLATQFLSTPLHLIGLDLYNRPQVTTQERFFFLRREYLKSTLARLGRIAPAYGIGGVANRKIVTTLREKYLSV